MVKILEQYWEKTWIAVTNGIERDQRKNMSCHTLICGSQQQVKKRLIPKERISIPHVLGCEQLVWMFDLIKVD